MSATPSSIAFSSRDLDLIDFEGIDRFIEVYSLFVVWSLDHARLFPRFGQQRIAEAHGAWRNDLSRVGNNEPRLDDGLDHFKQCGHLVFWLRRMSPVVSVVDLTASIQDGHEFHLRDEDRMFRDFLMAYMNEYLSFDLGFQICKRYEIDSGHDGAGDVTLTPEYYAMACHFMKYKHVSPHSLSLVYKSLFFSR